MSDNALPDSAVPDNAVPDNAVPDNAVPDAAPDNAVPDNAVPDESAEPTGVPRPLAVAGLIAAAWCVGLGLVLLMTVTLVGWIAAPRTALGPGLPGVFRTAVNFWLVAHHAGFSLADGRVGLLPLGLMVLPGLLLHRGGSWVIRAARVDRRPRIGVVHAALALAVPYAVLAALLALAAGTPVVRPSAWQALLVCFLLATVAGGLGAARALVATRVGRVRSGLGALLRLLPDRPRSLLVGVVGALAVLVAAGALLVGASLAMHLPEARALHAELAPGLVGGVLLLLVELVFLPNAVIWGMAYAIGPGFAVGAGTSVSPTGVFLDVVPSFPPLAALPQPGPAPALSLLAMAAPVLAGVVGGVLTVRAMPCPAHETAPLWGFATGALTGAVCAVLAALSGGPLGGDRLATMGPSAWQVGLLAALEVGVCAAIAAWAGNWLLLRRPAPQADSDVLDVTEVADVADVSDEPEPPARRRGSAQKRAERRAKKERRSEPARPARRTVAEPPPQRAPARRASPLLMDALEFEEAEPVLAPRRTSARRPRVPTEPTVDAPRDVPGEINGDMTGDVPGSRAGSGAADIRVSEDFQVEREAPQEAVGKVDLPDLPDPPDSPDSPDLPEPRPEPGRTERRGGAIFVLREDADED